jgi:hypothetical protein
MKIAKKFGLEFQPPPARELNHEDSVPELTMIFRARLS